MCIDNSVYAYIVSIYSITLTISPLSYIDCHILTHNYICSSSSFIDILYLLNTLCIHSMYTQRVNVHLLPPDIARLGEGISSGELIWPILHRNFPSRSWGKQSTSNNKRQITYDTLYYSTGTFTQEAMLG